VVVVVVAVVVVVVAIVVVVVVIGCSGERQLVGTFECGNEPLGSIKYGKFLD
jgi:NADH:ubiquinone oxidoreductase subunit 3 (subunit A)